MVRVLVGLVMERRGVFTLCLFADSSFADSPVGDRLERMLLFPGGKLSAMQAIEVITHLLDVQGQLLIALLDWCEEGKEVGAAEENRLAADEPEGGQGLVFDATA